MNERDRGDGITFDLMEFADDAFWLGMEPSVQHDYEISTYIAKRLAVDPDNKELKRWQEKVTKRWADLPQDVRTVQQKRKR